ncbi:MAG: hypothetical protein ACH346_06420 [Chthoniobacterales bacterium]
MTRYRRLDYGLLGRKNRAIIKIDGLLKTAMDRYKLAQYAQPKNDFSA